MTEPQPHELGYTYNGGEKRPFNGPFVENRDGRILRRGERPVWAGTEDFLTPADLALEQSKYFTTYLGWSYDQQDRWVKGDYEPEPTVRSADIQLFLDRLRKEHNRNSGLAPFRYLWSTEYGGVTGRPHWHLLLFGYPHARIKNLYQLWEEYDDKNGHVFPDLHDTTFNMTSVLRDRAATYQAKDLVKSRHETLGHPGKYDVEIPKVKGSKHPPIGDGGYLPWFENKIGKVLSVMKRYHIPFGYNREVETVRAIRANYSSVQVKMTGKRPPEVFPTTANWRRRVREDLGISDDLWSQATQENQKYDEQVAELITNNVDGIGDEFDEYTQQLRDRVEETKERQRESIAAKRAKLVASGKL